MLSTVLLFPAPHGQLGSWDEVLVFCLPVVIAVVVLAVTSRRARHKLERNRPRTPADQSTPDETGS